MQRLVDVGSFLSRGLQIPYRHCGRTNVEEEEEKSMSNINVDVESDGRKEKTHKREGEESA
jgi:hypothetical protein